MGNPIPTASRLLVAERDQYRCVRCGAGRGLHWHHRRSRRVLDEHTHCPCNGISLCGVCHSWVHANPRQAIRFGYLLSSHIQHPWKHPVLHVRWQWVLLGHDETFTLTEKGTT